MDGTKVVLILAVVVAISGCTDNGETESEGDQAITVNELSVTPQSIHQGDSVTATLRVTNTGRLPADLQVGRAGTNVLRNYCRDIFTIPGYGTGDATDVEGFQTEGTGGGPWSYTLENGQSLSMQWELQEDYAFDIPRPGLDCNLKFDIPFEYSVQAFRQVQVKSSEDIEGSELQSKSSRGPLMMSIRSVGGVSNEEESTYVAGEDDSMRLVMRLVNQGQEGANKGVIDVHESSLEISMEGPGDLTFTERFTDASSCAEYDWCVSMQEGLPEYCTSSTSAFQRCTGESSQEDALHWTRVEGGGEPACDIDEDTEIRMFEGESRDIVCDLPVPEGADLEDPAEIAEISANVSYTYKKDAGTRTIEVERRAGG